MSKIRVMSFNIHHGRGTDNKVDLQRIADFIHKSGADIIGLNEVDKHFSDRSEFVNQSAWLAENLKMSYIFGPAITIPAKGDEDARQYGNAFLSKLPILSSVNHPYDFIPKLLEDRGLLEVDVKLGQRPIKVYITHLSIAPFLHRRQVAYIKEKVKKDTSPLIVMGDWNMRPYSRGWKAITTDTRLMDVCEKVKETTFLTYPSSRPRTKLDYIFTSIDFTVKSVEIPKQARQLSDHLPLITDLKLSEE